MKFTNTNRVKGPSGQQGAALIIALIVMALVSVMGLSALRSSMLSGRVATGVQADAMTFEAAETALAVTYASIDAMSENQQFSSLTDGIEFCVTANGSASEGGCGGDAWMDRRSLLRAGSTSFFNGYTPRDGFGIGQTGTSAIFVDYNVTTLAESEMPQLELENFHLQESMKTGLLPMSEIN
ncbi:hypothetical protein HX099_04500 [Thiopseudomonas alkaliphila]|uniref:Type 4 fimbrial biogenesis protein PilX N-terminal domain-containing protein n=2 Tax=Thiopseudomonas alkaliphila TaxID=1697053 RepID=A0AAW7DQG9_9GAMM|nr:hypothetical protein [Thiopseudomonas alkaliphila]